MSFLIHRDTSIAWARGLPGVRNRFHQHRGLLHVSVMSLMSLASWLLRPKTPARFMQSYTAIMQETMVMTVDEPVAARAARLGASLHGQKPPADARRSSRCSDRTRAQLNTGYT
jgi:hypothetical protein